jgi:hypothetical protein
MAIGSSPEVLDPNDLPKGGNAVKKYVKPTARPIDDSTVLPAML